MEDAIFKPATFKNDNAQKTVLSYAWGGRVKLSGYGTGSSNGGSPTGGSININIKKKTFCTVETKQQLKKKKLNKNYLKNIVYVSPEPAVVRAYFYTV